MSHVAEAPLRVIGIGSPYGGDTVGWQAIVRMREEIDRFPPGTELHALDRPGSSLIPLLEKSKAVVLIDAMQSNQYPGTVQRLHLGDLLMVAAQPSSHSLGVAETLNLAKVLGSLPETLLIYGIEASDELPTEQWYPNLLSLLDRDISI